MSKPWAPNGATRSLAIIAAVAARPRLIGTALTQAVRLTPNGWWLRWPFLPLPCADYLAFRASTHRGGPAGARLSHTGATTSDVLSWLSWCAGTDATMRFHARAVRALAADEEPRP